MRVYPEFDPRDCCFGCRTRWSYAVDMRTPSSGRWWYHVYFCVPMFRLHLIFGAPAKRLNDYRPATNRMSL